LEGLVAVSAAVGAPGGVASERPGVGTKVRDSRSSGQAIDFRYAPRLSQATICFPDDPMKSLIGQAGDLRYGFAQDLQVGMEDFATVCRFSLAGMPDDRVVRQWLEAPHIPIVHTLGERPTATFELTAFATRHAKRRQSRQCASEHSVPKRYGGGGSARAHPNLRGLEAGFGFHDCRH
jgi:hypothetical protein